MTAGLSVAPISVAVFADDERVRNSLRHLLTCYENTVVVETASVEFGSAQALPAASDGALGQSVDVIVIDLAPAPAESHRALLGGLPRNVPIVALGYDEATAVVVRAAGATYLDKADVADRLFEAVHTAAIPHPTDHPRFGLSPKQSRRRPDRSDPHLETRQSLKEQTMSTTTSMLDRPEGRIAYDVTGHGPLVVCVPGMGELRSVYRFTVPALAGAGLRVVTMDLRGHGDSDATFSTYDDVAAGSDALTLIEHLGGPAVLVGNSMGAGAAVWGAAERPDLVAGIALIGPFVRNPKNNPLKAAAFRAMMSGPWASKMWLSYLPTLYPTRKPDDFSEHLAQLRETLRRPGHAKAFAATTRTSHDAAEQRLSKLVSLPALVIMGAEDPDFPDSPAEAAWIAEQLVAKCLIVPGAGHYPHVEFPDVVNPALEEFCSQFARVR